MWGKGTDCGISCSLSMGAQRDMCCLTGPMATQTQGELLEFPCLCHGKWEMHSSVGQSMPIGHCHIQ